MPTSYTNNLGLALPVQGELAGSWGIVVNQEITELLDSAIAGTTTLSSDADVTLTDTDGAANQTRQAILLWTATGSTLRTITAPARTKAYIVINATGGTQSIKLVGAGPTTGITVVAGERCLAAWNGSDFVKVASSVADGVTTIDFGTTGLTPNTATSGAVTVAGTLAVANGGTGATTAANARTNLGGTTVGQSYFTLTNPSAITFPRMNADNTVSALNAADFRTAIGAGTGAGTVTSVAVSGGTTGLTTSGGPITTSGTITLAGTLGTTNGGTGLTSFTANGVVYASSTSALTTGSALTFDGAKFNVSNGSSQAIIQSTDTFGTGSFLRILGDAQAGNLINWTTGTALRFATSDSAFGSFSEQMRLTSTGLGIGTSSPGAKLDVAGTSGTIARFTNTSANQSVNLAITAGTNSHAYQTITRSNVSYDAQQVWVPSGALSSSNPQWGAGFSFNDSGNNWKLTTYDGGTTTTDRLVVSTSGNLGLGVTPSGWSSVAGTQALQIGGLGSHIFGTGIGWSATPFLYIGNNAYHASSAWRYSSSQASAQYVQTGGQHEWLTAPSGTAGNAISFTQAMTLTAAGDLGIGTTSVVGSLHIAKNDAELHLEDPRTTSDGSHTVKITAYKNSVGYNNLDFDANRYVFKTNATERARIDASGNFGIGLTPSGSYKLEVSGTAAATDFNSTSDRNKKTNIATIQDSITKVQALRGVEFDWKDTGKHSVGLIAQEVEAVIPEAVQGEEGNKTVSYGNLVGLLIEAIKEQQQQISTLKAEVAALKGA